MYIDEEAKKSIGNKLSTLRILKWLTWVLSRLGAVNTIPCTSYTLIDIDIHLLDSKQQLESPVKDEGHYYDPQSSDSSLFFYLLQPILFLSFSLPFLSAITTVFCFFSLLSIFLFLFVSLYYVVFLSLLGTRLFCRSTLRIRAEENSK